MPTKPTDRQLAVLRAVVEHYTATAEPVSSQSLIVAEMGGVSSATVRNDMAALERLGLIEKPHTSSGRTPSVAGYKLYHERLARFGVSADVQRRLRAVLAERNVSISEVIAKAMAIISEVTSLPSVITEEGGGDLLKRIDLVPLTKTSATFLVVTSSGAVSNNVITMDRESRMADIAVCVRIFNDRLVDTPLRDVPQKIKALEPVIRAQIGDYEYVIQEVVRRVFAVRQKASTKLLDLKSLTTQPEFRDVERLEKVLALLEDATVWKQIAHNQAKTGRTTIGFGAEIGLPQGVAVALTPVHAGGQDANLALVGPTRMDFASVTSLLDFLREEIQRSWGDDA